LASRSLFIPLDGLIPESRVCTGVNKEPRRCHARMVTCMCAAPNAATGESTERINMHWYLEVLKKYAVFEGRARRKEYWFFVLFNLIISFVLGFIEGLFGGPGVLGAIYGLAVLIPGIAVAVRRLHDTGRSGWWLLIALVPVVGFIVLLVFMVLDSTPGPNQYGPNPKEVSA